MKKELIAEWKPVSLNEAIFNGDFKDLIGIEECVDYNLDDDFVPKKGKRQSDESPVRITKKKKRNKIKTEKQIFDLTPSKSGNTSNCCLNVDFEYDGNKMQAWDEYNLSELLIKGLYAQNFTHPTKIQMMTLHAAISGKDILGAAETGSGKTLAFGLPILNSIIKMKQKEENINLFALILTPTRELAMQVKNHLEKVAEFTDIKIAVVVGGMASVKQERILNKHPEIVVATPGRLWELIQSGHEHFSKIEKIKFLVIDETDRMLEKGHFQELENLLEKINFGGESKKFRQNFVFSATLTLIHDLPKYLTSKIRKRKLTMTSEKKLGKIIKTLGITNPKIVDITEGVGLSETLTESKVTCSLQEKDYFVYYFMLKHPGRTIIFCNSIGCVKRLANLFELLECHLLPLHASMQQKQRLKNLEKFRDGKNSVMVATDVAARGLDIPHVEHVIHYQIPRTSENYVHRSGRTARADKNGLTLLLIDDSELQDYIKICKTLNKTEDIPTFPIQQNVLEAIKQRVNLARELDKLQLHVRRKKSENGWLEKAAKEMDIIVDEMESRNDSEDELFDSKNKKMVECKKKQLLQLLQKPIIPKGTMGKYCLATSNLTSLERTLELKENAVDLMKNVVTNKKRSNTIYKPKKTN